MVKCKQDPIQEVIDYLNSESSRIYSRPQLSKFHVGPEPSLLVVDLFCGAGGTSTGFANSNIAKIIACVNHDEKAINSHWANHPDVEHFTEDMRTLDLTKLIALCRYWKAIYPNAKLVLWASLECTNFSKAKGGMARDADSRTLADHLHRYIVAINPDIIQIENVTEFRDWGPCRIKAKNSYTNYTELTIIKQKKTGRMVYGWVPVKELKGIDFKRWCGEVCSHGYTNEWKEMNSADFGAYTSRNRLFGMFAKPGINIVWPKTTHSKKGVANTVRWKAVKHVLNFDNQGYTIFDRGGNMDIPIRQRKNLCEKTFERIYAGLIKFIAGGKSAHAFMLKYHGGNRHERSSDINSPLGVIDTQNRHSILQPAFIAKYYSGKPDGKVISIDGPAGTIKTADGQSLIQPSFISVYHGNGHNCHSVDQPAPVIPTKDGLTIVESVFLDKYYSGDRNNQDVNRPAGSILPNDKHNLISTVPFILNTHYDNTATSIEDPLRTITADSHYAYLLNPSWGGCSSSVETPCPVIVASQHKAPMYVVVTEEGMLAIEIYDTDLPIVRKIKEFMALYGIMDIKMRMLDIPELLQIQGFPKKYRLDGSQKDQKKFIGNSVVPDVVEHWARALHFDLTGELLKAA